uniref:Cytosine-specific methyltransferase n=1 Tax=Kalanchoe fedtschenkoi TaxID=63787 RepID=A0A7N0RBA2_KALFE
MSIITLLKEQIRVSRLSFSDVIKKVSGYDKNHPAFISSNIQDVERYVVAHGQIILHQFSQSPDERIRKCAFMSGLLHKMQNKQQCKWMAKNKKVLQKTEIRSNPRALLSPVSSKRKTMQATTTRFISRIWKEYYSVDSLKDSNNGEGEKRGEVKDDKEVFTEEATPKDVEENKLPPYCVTDEPLLVPKMSNVCPPVKIIEWTGEAIGKTYLGEAVYKQAIIDGEPINVGTAVLMKSSEDSGIYFVEYMFESANGKRLFHGRNMQLGSQTILGNVGNEREVFLTNDCLDSEIKDIKQTVTVVLRNLLWGHQHRKDNIDFDEADRVKAEERKKKQLPVEYYCKSLYRPEKGAFLRLPFDTMGIGSGFCYSCDVKQSKKEKDAFRLKSCKTAFEYKRAEYTVHDFIYVSYDQFAARRVERSNLKSSRNVGLKAYVICQILNVVVPEYPVDAHSMSTHIQVRRFFRPDDISAEMTYSSDIREVFYSEEKHSIAVDTIEGSCEVLRKIDVPPMDNPAILDHIFFCERYYDSSSGFLKQIPASIKLNYTTRHIMDESDRQAFKPLAMLDIFAGCGGLSAGLQKAGASMTKWAIEYEESAGEAFKLNHPESVMFIDNCNVILRAVMKKCGDADDCVSTLEAAQLSESLEEKSIQNLPLPGEVDFISGGPPCQGFSGLNRFNHSTWSKVQSEMILAFLSFVDYFRPKFVLLENVRAFISFNKGQTFHLALASLLAMGYQVRFGILEAGNFGVSQSRKRAFIWAASPEEILPEWPEPMHVFSTRGLQILLPADNQYVAVRSTANGAPFRAITVRDTIGDLPAVRNGASKTILEYENGPASWFQEKIRQRSKFLTDHISKEMNELNFIRCKKIPKRPGADWRDLSEEKVKLFNGQVVDLIPGFLPNTAKRHNQWKGVFGRLDWEGNFPTSVTDPQPMGTVGMCFHPDQDRIVSVRECARSQGFSDRYKYVGNIHEKHRQIGNAVPPPVAFALGMKLKEALAQKKPN